MGRAEGKLFHFSEVVDGVAIEHQPSNRNQGVLRLGPHLPWRRRQGGGAAEK